MKKVIALTCTSLVILMGMSGCSMNDTVNKDKKIAQNPAENQAALNDKIENVMNYLKEQGVVYTDAAPINNIGFAAYEGHTFNVDGSKAYLYRVKLEDADMSALMKEARDKGRVRVNIDNNEKEYVAKVNGSYLLLYDEKAKMSSIMNAFPNYTPNKKNANNSSKSDNNQTTKNDSLSKTDGME